MATVVIDLDDRVYARLRAAADARGTSVEADVRDLVEARLQADDGDLRARAEAAAARLRAYREQRREALGPETDSVEWLRADRQAW